MPIKKKNYVLKRTDFTQKSSIGTLSLDGKFICYTLEDRTRAQGEPKVYGETAMPYGTYRLIVDRSNRFSKLAGRDVYLPLFLDTPGFAGCRIHKGNKPEDVEGCVVVGTSKAKDWVSGSKDAFDPLFAQLKNFIAQGYEIWVTITK
jgi:hypothetical protein